MTLEQLNQLSKEEFREEMLKCCGSNSWVDNLYGEIPFSSVPDLKSVSDRIWFSCSPGDWLEAFTHHPKIGDLKSIEKKIVSTKDWASGEQSTIHNADKNVLSELANANMEYEKKFGYIFIVCATGKTAPEMLSILQQRLTNDAADEIRIAAKEQNKITHIRIDKLLS